MEMFKSATRVSLLLLLIALISINIYSLIFYPNTVFKDVFSALNTTIVAVTSYFFGKSASETKQNTTETPVKEDLLVVEK